MLTEFIIVLETIVLFIFIARKTISWYYKKIGINFKNYEDLDIPVVTMKNGDKEFNFIVDTGSSLSHIDTKLVKKLRDTEIVDVFTSGIITAEGNKTVEENKGVKIPIVYKEQVYYESFLPLDLSMAFEEIYKDSNIKIHGILGNTFLSTYNFIIDYDSKKLYIE